VALELEVAGGLAVDDQLPETDVRCAEMTRELLVRPVEPVVPVPGLTDLAIEAAVQLDRTGRAPLDPGARVGERCLAELSRVVEREIRSNDLDASQTSAP
jgi:hypothetical protein